MELIKISQAQIGESAVNAVSLRELYKTLELDDRNYARWSRTNIVDSCLFVEGRDYITLHNEECRNLGNFATDYILTIDTAKHLCMLARTQKAHQIREYFIECEKQLTSQYKIPQTYAKSITGIL